MNGSCAGARAFAAQALSACVALSAGLASCASGPPLRFYTLSPVGSESTGAETPPAIRVARVTLPGEIDRAEIVQRIDVNRVKLAEEDRWAAPLGEMIRRTLSDDLHSRAPGTAADPDVLSVDIEEFLGDASCAVSLRAAWSLKRGNAGQPFARGYESIRIEPPPTCQVSALPQGMSRALAELSNRIVSARAK